MAVQHDAPAAVVNQAKEALLGTQLQQRGPGRSGQRQSAEGLVAERFRVRLGCDRQPQTSRHVEARFAVADFAAFSKIGGQPGHGAPRQIEIELGFELDLRHHAFRSTLQRALDRQHGRRAVEGLERSPDIVTGDRIQAEQNGQQAPVQLPGLSDSHRLAGQQTGEGEAVALDVHQF